jgi:hypothetical protein
MDATQYAGNSYLTVEDLADGPRTDEKIIAIFVGAYEKLVLQFASGAALSLNVTNTRRMIKAFGEETEGWNGKLVELYVGEIPFKGVPTKSIMVRPPEKPDEKPDERGDAEPPAAPHTPALPPPVPDYEDEIPF